MYIRTLELTLAPSTVEVRLAAARTLYRALHWSGATEATPFENVKVSPDPTPDWEKRGAYSTTDIEPILPIQRPRYGAIGMSNRRPAVLCINVSALADAAIPAHAIHLMATDDDAALKSLVPAEREAWNDYLGKAKRSSIYGAKRRTRHYRRTRSESGKP